MKEYNKIITFVLRSYEDEQKIADQLLQGNIVIADLKYLRSEHFDLVVSFLEGVLFGLGREIVFLREDMLLLLPEQVYYEKDPY